MDELSMLELARNTLTTALLIVAPPLLVGMFVGLAISLFQTITSLQEQTLTLVPKMLAVVVVGLFLLAPALSLLRDFALRIISELNSFGLS